MYRNEKADSSNAVVGVLNSVGSGCNLKPSAESVCGGVFILMALQLSHAALMHSGAAKEYT